MCVLVKASAAASSSAQCKSLAALRTPNTLAGVSCAERNSVHRPRAPLSSRYMHALSTPHIVSCVSSSVPLYAYSTTLRNAIGSMPSDSVSTFASSTHAIAPKIIWSRGSDTAASIRRCAPSSIAATDAPVAAAPSSSLVSTRMVMSRPLPSRKSRARPAWRLVPCAWSCRRSAAKGVTATPLVVSSTRCCRRIMDVCRRRVLISSMRASILATDSLLAARRISNLRSNSARRPAAPEAQRALPSAVNRPFGLHCGRALEGGAPWPCPGKALSWCLAFFGGYIRDANRKGLESVFFLLPSLPAFSVYPL
eukprot:scaffold10248_cov65-Phaeocystis_antarctica.AAC.6